MQIDFYNQAIKTKFYNSLDQTDFLSPVIDENNFYYHLNKTLVITL